MTSPQQQVIDKCKAVFALAKTLYNVDLEKSTHIRFDLRGRVAGTAGSRFGTHTLRFNHDMLLRELEEIRDVVVPHEIAHLVCHVRRELGSNHDYGWRRVCIALGGTGDRTHKMEVVFGNGRTYEYTTDRGHKVRLNERRHQHVQSGRQLAYRRGLGTVSKLCAYSIVGVSGRTLEQPVVRQAAALPAVNPAIAEIIRRAGEVQTVRVTDLTGEVPVHSVVTLPPLPAPRQLPRIAGPVQHVAEGGTSKAAVSRNIMAAGYRSGESYETIISKMMSANGYNRQLARATFKANAARVNIPSSFGQ